MGDTTRKKYSVITYAGKEFRVEGWFDLQEALAGAIAKNSEVINVATKNGPVVLRVGAGIPILVDHKERTEGPQKGAIL